MFGSDKNRPSTVILGVPKKLKHNNRDYRITTTIGSIFMFNEFTREITDKYKNRYHITNAIVDNMFTQPQYDSIIYPSVKNLGRLNILMKEKRG